MKKAPKPQIDSAPRLMAVAVQSLTPEFVVYNTATGEIKRVIGGNTYENNVYAVPGEMPKEFRMANEDGNYEHELLFEPLPNTFEEISLSENPECKLLITNFTLIEQPEEKQKPKPKGCTVIQHPSAAAALEVEKENSFKKKTRRLVRQAARNRDTHTLYLFPELHILNQTG
jgi:hypothetical protein